MAANCGDKDAVSLELVWAWVWNIWYGRETAPLCAMKRVHIIPYARNVRAYEREWMDVGNVKIETVD